MRLSISIGCDNYERLPKLGGAELDATRMHQALTNSEFGGYDPDKSILLKSPSTAAVVDCLSQCLSGSQIETLTIYFAGHGELKAGSFYICLANTDRNRLSGTAVSFAQIFNLLNESPPEQTNIIIDACNAGGLIGDLPSLLKPELIGRSGTPGVSLFCSSAADQYSLETSSGGVATSALIPYLMGHKLIQVGRAWLDLTEVGLSVSHDVKEGAEHQAPVVWGLNLTGPGKFTKNRNYNSAQWPLLPDLARIRPGSVAAEILGKKSPSLWRFYYDLVDGVDLRATESLLQEVIEALPADGSGAKTTFLAGIIASFRSRLREGEDTFEEIEVLALGICLLARLLPVEPNISGILNSWTRELLEAVNTQAKEIEQNLERDTFALLNKRGSHSELYYLPLRVARLYGWFGGVVLIDRLMNAGTPVENLLSAAAQIQEKLPSAITPISDEQAAYYFLWLLACYKEQWNEQGEFVIGQLFYSLQDRRGFLGKRSLPADKVMEFLLCLNRTKFDGFYSLLARPAELPSVLLYCAKLFDLLDEMDRGLHNLDHVPLNIFVPRDLQEFADDRIEYGLNVDVTIGHNCFTTQEFFQIFSERVVPRIKEMRNADKKDLVISAILASLLFPDRCCWFLVAGDELEAVE